MKDKYIVQPGDTLWSIARRFIGCGARWPMIYSCNRRCIKDPDLIYPGQTIVVPRPRRVPPPVAG